MSQLNKISIRPGVSILSVLKHLNYKPYYALAEFVDNSIDSYLKNEIDLKRVDGEDYRLEVKIEFNHAGKKIIIRDNAAGIQEKDYQRAFRAAEIPPDNTKLSEFGMGMKSAACWFSNSWEVRTTAIGESVERTISFDINNILNDQLEELDISYKKVPQSSHYTVITIKDVGNKMPVKNGLGKVKKHLASIYRQFERDNKLTLLVQGEKLKYDEPEILKAPSYANMEGEPILWKKEVSFSMEEGVRISGFVALMETMSASNSGFALFRRGRVIEGSADKGEGFRPALISGSLGSHRYKRLFGELHLEGFEVSHTKDGFQWGDRMDEFLKKLKQELEKNDSLPILKQADRYRVRESKKNYKAVSEKVVASTTSSVRGKLDSEIDSIRGKVALEDSGESLSKVSDSYFETFDLKLNDCDWRVHVEVSYDDSVSDLIQVGDHLIPPQEGVSHHREIGLRLSLVHPFMVQFAGDNKSVIEPILRIAVGLVLSEVIAKETNSPVSEVRITLNELLRGSLSKI